MPIYIGDYLRDTQALTAEEHGVYFLLLMHYWQKKGEMGADVKRLAMVARADIEMTKNILESFFILEDGNYKNKRADEELKAAKARSDSAKANINKRWNKDSNTDVTPAYNSGNTDGHTESIPIEYSSSPSPSPSPSSSSPVSISPQPKKEEEEPVFIPPRLQQNPENARDGCARIELARSLWNAKAPQIGPPCRLNALTFREEDRSDCLRIMSAYSDADILQAIENYEQVKASPEHEIKSPYQSFAGFIRGGVEKFISEANPFGTFRIKAPAWQKPERGGALDDRPDATTPERIAQDNAESAEEAMSAEDYAAGLEALRNRLRPEPLPALAKTDEAGVL
jgi:uncharacterized protein YdaU (DUF1376 family)